VGIDVSIRHGQRVRLAMDWNSSRGAWTSRRNGAVRCCWAKVVDARMTQSIFIYRSNNSSNPARWKGCEAVNVWMCLHQRRQNVSILHVDSFSCWKVCKRMCRSRSMHSR